MVNYNIYKELISYYEKNLPRLASEHAGQCVLLYGSPIQETYFPNKDEANKRVKSLMSAPAGTIYGATYLIKEIPLVEKEAVPIEAKKVPGSIDALCE